MKREVDTIPTPTHIKPKKLIVLSAPRTGTHGLYLALKQLGFTPYHMAEVLTAGAPAVKMMADGMKADWYHKGTPYGRAEFDKWFAKYDIIIEMPFFMLRSTLKAYPDAKFLLTERDPEKWANSFMNTVGMASTRFNSFPMSIFKKFDSFASTMNDFNECMFNYCTNSFGVSEEGHEALVENYKSYIANVKRLVPPEQLEVIKLEDGLGWKELCSYLDMPIPDSPWPSFNTREEFHTVAKPKLKTAAAKGMMGVATIIAAVAVVVWYCHKNLSLLLT